MGMTMHLLQGAQTMSTAQIKRRSFAFTLVELLVVVAIIALLLSILLPALGRARALASNVKCQAQQHQIGLAIELYANTNDDFLVPFNEQVMPAGYSGPDFMWLELLVPYVNGGTRDAANYEQWQDQVIGSTWLCPDFQQTYQQEMQNFPWRIGYGLNMFAGPEGASTNPWMPGVSTSWWNPGANPHTHKRMFKRTAWKRPTGKVLVGDCNDFNMHHKSAYHPPNNPGSAFDRHFNSGQATEVNAAGTPTGEYQPGASANFLFADGHVESHPFEQVVGNAEFFE
jgi:prepilin-type processing-associated H-X9-DG protein/prepilin-type N-terminal cleavage/methylation domain-containing protein